VEACFGPFSAQLAKVGSYRALEKEAQDLIGALHEKLERRRRDLQTGLGVGVRSKIKLTTLELKVCYISVELIFTYLLVIISANSCAEKNVLLLLFLPVVVFVSCYHYHHHHHHHQISHFSALAGKYSPILECSYYYFYYYYYYYAFLWIFNFQVVLSC